MKIIVLHKTTSIELEPVGEFSCMQKAREAIHQHLKDTLGIGDCQSELFVLGISEVFMKETTYNNNPTDLIGYFEPSYNKPKGKLLGAYLMAYDTD